MFYDLVNSFLFYLALCMGKARKKRTNRKKKTVDIQDNNDLGNNRKLRFGKGKSLTYKGRVAETMIMLFLQYNITEDEDTGENSKTIKDFSLRDFHLFVQDIVDNRLKIKGYD